MCLLPLLIQFAWDVLKQSSTGNATAGPSPFSPRLPVALLATTTNETGPKVGLSTVMLVLAIPGVIELASCFSRGVVTKHAKMGEVKVRQVRAGM